MKFASAKIRTLKNFIYQRNIFEYPFNALNFVMSADASLKKLFCSIDSTRVVRHYFVDHFRMEVDSQNRLGIRMLNVVAFYLKTVLEIVGLSKASSRVQYSFISKYKRTFVTQTSKNWALAIFRVD
jgi:hypothetical protein